MSYLVCASPRSGTELLCRGLAARRVRRQDPLELPALGAGEVLGDAPLRRAGPVAILRTVFPDVRVVDVTRHDRARQAVSWARMAQDGMWVDPVGQPEPAWPPPAGPPRYDYELITALEALIAKGETGWRQLYDELGLTPYQVVYEELSSPDGYEPTIRGVLAHLGLADYQGPPDAASCGKPVSTPRNLRFS
jgi:LPS sulfotransferase NodH